MSTAAPKVRLSVDGIQIQGLMQASIYSTNSFACDTFSIIVSVGSTPLTDISFWAGIGAAKVELAAIQPDNSSTYDLIVGFIDTVHLDPLRATVVVEGRDLSAGLIDSYRQQDFVNQTAAEVVTAIAEHHGLLPVVTATVGNVGRYYGDGYTRLSLGQFSKLRSDWDVIVNLARDNGFDAYVIGQSLYFQPPAGLGRIPLQVRLEDVLSMRIERAVAPSLGYSASVRSWSSQDMAYYVSQPDPTTGSDTLGGGVQPFLFTGANLTPSQVDIAAMHYSAEVQRLRTVLQFEMPWNPDVSPRSLILVTGTYSTLDTLYVVDSVERDYGSRTGTNQRVCAVLA